MSADVDMRSALAASAIKPSPSREHAPLEPLEFPTEFGSRAIDGAAFAFEETADVPSLWGDGQAVAWPAGEGLMLVGPDGVGKTALQQQLILARIGLRADLLSVRVERTKRRVLYVAADRPRQAARSFRRMVGEGDEKALSERLIVWPGPLPFDLAADPSALARFVAEHDAGELYIDALKDVALDLTKDETGSRVNRAFAETIAAGVELCVAHHQRKEQASSAKAGKPNRLADVYGSRWLTAGMGSVVLLWGEPGDLVVDLTHLKQPAEEIGPLQVLHDHRVGASSVFHPFDLEQLIDQAYGGLSVKDAAVAMFGKDKPNRNEIEKARRRLESLVGKGNVYRDSGRYLLRRT